MTTRIARFGISSFGMSLAATVAFAAAALGCKPEDTTVTQPVALSDSNPVRYPVALWDEHIEGETVLLVNVNEYGDVDSTRVEKTSGHVAFDSAASTGARKMRFPPGRRGEHISAMWTRMPVRFSMDSTAAIGVPVSPDTTQ
jgi:protein TonB